MSNLRPLRLEPPRGDPMAWLERQSDPVRRVTVIDATGIPVQRPLVEEGAFVDPTAQLIGGVIVGAGCYIGPYSVVRLDEKPSPEPLIIGEASNLQEGVVVHSTTQSIGRRVIVAHQAIVHGAQLEDDVSLYIQAVADGDGTIIGAGSFLHRGSYVGRGVRVPPGRLVEPGRQVLTQGEADALPPVPGQLIEYREQVLAMNQSHVGRYRLPITR